MEIASEKGKGTHYRKVARIGILYANTQLDTYIIEESCLDGNRALPLLLQQLHFKILWNSNRST